MSLEQEQHSREPPSTVRLAAAQPTKRAEPNSYLDTERERETGTTWTNWDQTNEKHVLRILADDEKARN